MAELRSWLVTQRDSETNPASGGGYPGEMLGMPPTGRGSLGRLWPRVLALLIDWLLCSLIAAGLFGYRFGGHGANGFVPLAVFFVENVLLVGTIGSTVGHRICGLQVRRLQDRLNGPVSALIRSVLLCLVIPAVIWDRDGRGLHDRVAGTVLQRFR
ncbi:RDD family protein [Rudaeicoccus suwonensis]|uniref:RDD family protein n=1 Tax=Rudaeicoccus suwonensis TaxID=657409 RepID=A0A561EC31_9MICO|nr:RDD family protein [Rudaeicoccus suwonensis]